MWPSKSPLQVFQTRRSRLASALGSGHALIAAGRPRAKNFPANLHRFRADSHFLYLMGSSIPDAALLLGTPRPTLFVPDADPADALWHGPSAGLEQLSQTLGLPVRPISELSAATFRSTPHCATVSPNDEATAVWLSALLGRPIPARGGARLENGSPDAELAEALISLRLVHDEGAIDQLRQAAAATALAHRAGLAATRPGIHEAEIAGAMVAALYGAGMGISYEPIVTVHGEVLHNEEHTNVVRHGDLVLADVGAETPEGWAGDVTRVWPAAGHFSSSQRDLYDLVLESQLAAIALVRPKVRYRAVHEAAARRLVEGLVDLGILSGSVDGLTERGAHTLFFPHGVGHLLGIDVHDMEDLGDRAGYASGRARSTRFGDRYLRLDRDLAPGMAVTIEPGFYQVPAILEDASLTAPFATDLKRDRLAHFADVRGIRIEDDVLVTEGDPEVLTASIPKRAADIEDLMRPR